MTVYRYNPAKLMRGAQVKKIQSELIEQGFLAKGEDDGVFGVLTEAAVIRFQQNKGLVVDGVVGAGTRAALGLNAQDTPDWKLKESDFDIAAESLGGSKAFIHAIAEVESNGDGFWASGQMKLLYERHVFYRLANQADLDLLAEAAALTYPDLCNKKTGGYGNGQQELARWNRAQRLNKTIGLESASYGRFQVMGFHWKRLGFQSVQGMVDYLSESESNQLDMLVVFIQTDAALLKAYVNEDCRAFKLIYNGPKENGYEIKLQAALDRYKGIHS